MKRVLMVAYYFPPVAATGAMRPLNFCRHLPVSGWRPTILATDGASALPPQATDEHLLERIPTRTEVIRVAHGNPLGRLLAYRARLKSILNRPDGGTNQSMRNDAAGSKHHAAKQDSMLVSARRCLVDAWLNFPDPQCRWYRPAVQTMLNRIEETPPDVIWTTGGPWTSLLVGKRLAQEWAVPFVADFRDPWIGGHEFFSSTLLHRRAAYLERAVCRAASRVVLNTEELRVRFVSEYPQWQHKFVTITNGYAQDPVSGASPMKDAESAMGAGEIPTLELCHFGTVYGNRSPLALFRAVHELMTEGRLDAARFRIRFVGAWDVNDAECDRIAKALEERGVLKRAPPIPHQQCLKEMSESDVLLILQPDYPLQVPAKIYEYIVAGRPLFVLGGEGATANLVQRHRLGRCCPNRVQETKQAIAELMSDRTSLAPPNPVDTEQFSYQLLSKRLASVLDAAVAERS